jgi:glycosyltransferase involved in cell wall biosynthesis
MHICLITSRIPPTRCGVGDYTMQLARALLAAGSEVTIVTGDDQKPLRADALPEIRNILPGWGMRGMLRLIDEVRHLKPSMVVVQWVPFLYSRFGVNPWLPLAAIWLSFSGYRVQTMVHEPWVPLTSWQYRITGPIQRLLLFMLIFASKRVGVSITAWTRLLQSYFPWRRNDIFWTPVGSNIIPTRRESDRAQLRAQLGISSSALVLAIFSPFGSGKGYDLIESLWQQTASLPMEIHLLVIGATAEEAAGILPALASDERVRFAGYLEPEGVSQWLQSADILLAPFTDGISARRGSALAAMAHGLPVVTTRGHLFDREIFEQSPLVITDYDSVEFTRATIELIRDRERRTLLGAATREFFDRNFAWPIIAGKIIGRV